MKKKTKQKRSKIILDTSFQIERLKFREFEQELDKLLATSDVRSLNYCLYEYKKGLIFALIDFYMLVGICDDVSKAHMKWSDRWGRDTKYITILEGVLSRLNDSIPTKNINDYLRQVEAAILYATQLFEMKVMGLIGDFPKNEIVRYNIKSSEDYENFVKLCKQDDIIPLDIFWNSHKNELQLMVDSKDLERKYKKLHAKLKKVSADTKLANSKRINHAIGDAVITADTPKLYTIATMDNSFQYLATPLGKQVVKFLKVV